MLRLREFFLGMSLHELLPRDAGYIFAPHVPLTQTPVVLDPNSFNPLPGITTRYSTDLLEQGRAFYGQVTIDCGDIIPAEDVCLDWQRYGF